MNKSRDKQIERKPGEDEERNPTEEAARIEDDVRANKGVGGLSSPSQNPRLKEH